jgi:ATP-dependent Clp protease ATP-binding subunit ClpX
MSILDPTALHQCEAARTELQKAEETLASARAEFERSVRRLYVEGASTREIAQKLGLSHQRVHQMIGSEPKSWWQRVFGLRTEPSHGCSFCGKASKDVAKLVAGPGVHICDGCIAAATTALKNEASTFQRLSVTARKRCSFCGSRKRGLSLATAGGHQICGKCTEIAEEIIRTHAGSAAS